MTEPQILSDEQVAKIEADWISGSSSEEDDDRNIGKLIQTVRAAWAETERLKERYQSIDMLRSVLRRLAVIVDDEPCWCNCAELKHSKVCRDARRLRIWPRLKRGESQ